MNTEDKKKIEDLEAEVVRLRGLVETSVEQTKAATDRANSLMGTVEDMATMFSEHVTSLDRRMDNVGKIFLSKLEKKLPTMVE